MFQNNLNLYQNTQIPSTGYSENIYARQYNTALNRFKSILAKARFARLKRRVLRRTQSLYDLNTLKPDLCLHGSCYAGIQVVPIQSIIGSEGRVADFDMDFQPMNEESRERWVNMAIVYLSRLPLPPIQLIQVGDAYFVRDGHHRISVSRAFGQVAMDAEVITWKAQPPFPWQTACQEKPFLLKSFDLTD
jgi:hypothetical protein